MARDTEWVREPPGDCLYGEVALGVKAHGTLRLADPIRRSRSSTDSTLA